VGEAISHHACLQTKIAEKSARVCVIGLGYVGLPLATAFAQRAYHVFGLDVDARKIASLRQGHSYIPDVESGIVADLIGRDLLHPTTDYEVLGQADIVFICVPTPFDAMKAPDLSFVRAAAEGIAPRLHAG